MNPNGAPPDRSARDDRFGAAVGWAWRLHRDQRRKGTSVPYVAHLLGVASLVLEHGGTEDEAIAALLHDAVEDQGGLARADEIRRAFGDHVADIVMACTDTTESPKPLWRARKEAFVERARALAPGARLVSAADKLHNARAIVRDLRALGDELWARFNAGRDDQLWYWDAIARALRAGECPPLTTQLLDDLDRVVDEMHRLAGVPRRR